ACGSFAPRRSEPSRFALPSNAPLRLTPWRSARERSAPVRSQRSPLAWPRKKRRCAARMSVSRLPLCEMLFGLRRLIILYLFGMPYFTGFCAAERLRHLARERRAGASVLGGMDGGDGPAKRGIPMKNWRRALGLMLFMVCAGVPAAKAQLALALTHVTVIDTAAGAARPDQTVVISAGKIAAVGAAPAVKVPKGARILDASGKFLIPGLWDMHVHIAGISADPAWSKNVILPELLAYGITGVRDMGGDLDALLAWRRDIEAGTLTGPHIVAGGP